MGPNVVINGPPGPYVVTVHTYVTIYVCTYVYSVHKPVDKITHIVLGDSTSKI